MKDYYAILGVSRTATTDEIKKAFRALALKHHPDRGGNAEKFKEVSEAYDYLTKHPHTSTYSSTNNSTYTYTHTTNPSSDKDWLFQFAEMMRQQNQTRRNNNYSDYWQQRQQQRQDINKIYEEMLKKMMGDDWNKWTM